MSDKMKEKLSYKAHFYMDFHWKDEYVGILESEVDGVKYYFIDNEGYFTGVKPYTDNALFEIEKYAYSDFGTIRLLHIDTNEVEEKALDDYIAEVVSAEMPVSYEMEALKAQSVAARTYTLYKLIRGTPHDNSDICDKASCCQAWISKDKRMEKWENNKQENWNKIVEAVNSTVRRDCNI